MNDLKRVRSTETGHEYTVRVVNSEVHVVLDKPATDEMGRPLPPVPATAAPSPEVVDTDQPSADQLELFNLGSSSSERNEEEDER